MDAPSILHILSPSSHVSPFDVTMAYDAGFNAVMPYANVTLADVPRLVQDAIFARGPKKVRRSVIFIGGRDAGLAMDMAEAAKKAMVPPYEASVFADPSGAFTTAAALVAGVESVLKKHHDLELQGCRAVVFGGTGPVGVATGVIASLGGAVTTLVDHLSIDTALEKANEFQRRTGTTLQGTFASSDADKARLVSTADVIFCTVKAGVQVLSASVLGDARQLKVAADVNAVPPLGIEGVGLKDFGVPIKYATLAPGALGIGALAVGDVKIKLQMAMLRATLEADRPLDMASHAEMHTRACQLV